MPLKKLKLIITAATLSFALVSCAHHKVVSYDKELNAAIDSRTAEDKVRDSARKPAETLKFFRVEPGMTVAEALPGGGWYSKIIANYLGSDGALYGINYDDDMWPRFGFFSEERIKERIAATSLFPEKVKTFTDNGIKAKGFTFSTAPDELAGTVDRVLMIRALHNLNRFEAKAGTRSKALKTVHKLLKKGGMVGLVQHQVAESVSDESAQGQRGYLKKSAVIKMFEEAGFELVDSSDIHLNSKDQPGEKDIVWRLPPTLLGSKDKPGQMKAMQAIGESNRMTLLFVKK